MPKLRHLPQEMRSKAMRPIVVFCFGFGLLFALATTQTAPTAASISLRSESNRPVKRDPAAWGSDHVGQPVPEFTSGGECLFCHRMDVGETWSKNSHQLTIRRAETAPKALHALRESPATKRVATEVQYVMGTSNRVRFLKRTDRYGQLALLSTAWSPSNSDSKGELLHTQNPSWDQQSFGRSCAGCHATAVDPKTETFSAVSLDCFTCHGNVALKHSKQPSKVIFSRKRTDHARVVMSICGQCHIRTGRSRSTGFPYANNFVPGDNLFRDLEVNWSDAHLKTLNPADRHVVENIRSVVVYGNTDVTCLSCHNIHKQSSRKHQQLAESAICLHCHKQSNFTERKHFTVHSRVCEY